jgi:hypothetical protein
VSRREAPPGRGLGPLERIGYAFLAAAAAAAAPLLLFFLLSRTTGDEPLVLWVVAPIVGPLVFQLVGRAHPDWGWGVAFAATLALFFGVWGGIRPPFEYSGTGQAALIGASLFAMTFLVGMVGASVASLVVRVFALRRVESGTRRLRPWHIGMAIGAVDVVVVLALAIATEL